MATTPNPFGLKGRIADAAGFFDREDLLRQIFEELNKGVNISLVGPSSIGKSSLLSKICTQGSTPETQAIFPRLSGAQFHYLSLEVVDTEDEFYEALCDILALPTCRGFALTRALRGQRHVLCLDEIEKMAWTGKSEATGMQPVNTTTARSALPFEVVQKVTGFLTDLAPLLAERSARHAFIVSAGLDAQLESHVNIDDPPGTFVPGLMKLLSNYGNLADGRYPIIAILQASKQFIGQDKQAQCDGLIQGVLTRVASQPQTFSNTVPCFVSRDPSLQGFSVKVRSHLRGLADGPDAPLKLVIASRSPLMHLFPDSSELDSPLAGICRQFDVTPFSPEVVRAFLLNHLQNTSVTFTEEQMQRLIISTGGHPAKLHEEAAQLYREISQNMAQKSTEFC